MPGPGGYWLWPSRIAWIAASATTAGPSVSGNPCPRLIAPVRTAGADISAKIVVPNPAMRPIDVHSGVTHVAIATWLTPERRGLGRGDFGALADHGDAFGGDGEAAGAVVLVVDADLRTVWDDHALVDDRSADDGAPADVHVVGDHRRLDRCPVADDHARRQHRVVHDR